MNFAKLSQWKKAVNKRLLNSNVHFAVVHSRGAIHIEEFLVSGTVKVFHHRPKF